jgi:hypothetical protein
MSLATDLISYWSLDEASGTRFDAHGSNDLSETGTVGSTTGKIGNAASFTASSQMLSVASNSTLQAGTSQPFTLAFWYYPTSTDGTKNVISKGVPGVDAEEYGFLQNNTVIQWRFSSFQRINSPDFLTVNQWYFIVGFYNTSSPAAGVSVNGSTYSTGSLTASSTNSSPFRISVNTSQFAAGRIDEAAFWKRSLSQSEVTELYNSGAGRDYAYVSGAGGGDLVLRRRKMYHHLQQLGA